MFESFQTAAPCQQRRDCSSRSQPPVVASCALLHLPPSTGEERHNHRPYAKLPCPASPGKISQVAARAADGGTALQNAGNGDRRVTFAHCFAGLLPSTWTDPEHRSHRRNCREEVAPISDACPSIVGQIGTGIENHA